MLPSVSCQTFGNRNVETVVVDGVESESYTQRSSYAHASPKTIKCATWKIKFLEPYCYPLIFDSDRAMGLIRLPV